MRTLEDEIQRVLDDLEMLDLASEEHERAVKILADLMEIKKSQQPVEPVKESFKIPWEPIINGVFSIGGMLLVLNFEKVDIVTSKAFGWIRKP